MLCKWAVWMTCWANFSDNAPMNEALVTAKARKCERAIAYALVVVLAYFPLFMNLDVLPLRMFDESARAADTRRGCCHLWR